MCARFNQRVNQSLLFEQFDLAVMPEALPEMDLFPLWKPVGAIRRDESDRRVLELMDWGFLPAKWKPTSQYPDRKKYQRQRFNARSEAVHETWAFRDAFRDPSRRCLIPFRVFEEKKHYFGVEGREVSAFAGLWDRCEVEGETIVSCTILTTDSNELVGKYHPRKRMPVILDSEEDRRLWENADLTEREPLERLFEPFDAGRMTCEAAEDK